MAEHKATPQIRFTGFSDDWEERELGYWADRYDNLRVPITASDRVLGNTPYYGANGIQDYVKGYTHDGEFILIAEDGANDLQNYPVQYVNGKIWVNNHAHVLQAKKDIADNKFLKYVISQTDIEPFLVGGSRAKLNSVTMMGIIISAPKNIQEQKRIGNYFKNIDTLIDLHQRKYDKLIQLKKAMLEKMFPKNGSKAPEIRFAGYNTEPWIQRNFIDIVNRTSNLSEKKTLPRVEYEDIVSGQGILNKDLRKKVSLKKGILFQQGDVLFGKLRPYLKNWILSDFSGIAVGDFWVFRTCGTDCKFVYSLIQSNQFQDVVNQSTGTKMPRADWPLVSTATFSIPYTVDEQNKVGTLFLKLDNLINLHQRKYDKLIQLKKAMLEKMFV